MADGGHICRRTGTKFGRAQLDHRGDIPDKFRKKKKKKKKKKNNNNEKNKKTKKKKKKKKKKTKKKKKKKKQTNQWFRRRCDSEKLFMDGRTYEHTDVQTPDSPSPPPPPFGISSTYGKDHKAMHA